MILTKFVDVLKVECSHGTVYPLLLHDDEHQIIVDTGYPFAFEPLKKAVEEAGYKMSDMSGILLSHQDIDHIGCVHEIMSEAKNCHIYAHKDEVPYLNGSLLPIKLKEMEDNYQHLTTQQLDYFTLLQSSFSNRQMHVDYELDANSKFDFCGGVEIVETPGHTPGHICIYLPHDKIMFIGDLLQIDNGKLAVFNPSLTQDLPLSLLSTKKLLNYDIQTIVTYHSGIYTTDIHKSIQELINEN